MSSGSHEWSIPESKPVNPCPSPTVSCRTEQAARYNWHAPAQITSRNTSRFELAISAHQTKRRGKSCSLGSEISTDEETETNMAKLTWEAIIVDSTTISRNNANDEIINYWNVKSLTLYCMPDWESNYYLVSDLYHVYLHYTLCFEWFFSQISRFFFIWS